jgi:hypothetical protein
MDITTARTLDKDELSRATGIGVEVVRKMTSDGTIPDRFQVAGDGRERRYVPAAVALIAFVNELHAFFGPHSPIPRSIVKRPEVVSMIEMAWREGKLMRVTIAHEDNVEITIKRSDCVGRARHQLAQLV